MINGGMDVGIVLPGNLEKRMQRATARAWLASRRRWRGHVLSTLALDGGQELRWCSNEVHGEIVV